MKKIIGIVITTLCLCLVVACGARSEKVNLEKQGRNIVQIKVLVFIILMIL